MNAGHSIDWSDQWWSPVDRVEMLVNMDGLPFTFENCLKAATQQNRIYPPRLAAQVVSRKRNGPPLYFGQDYG